MKLLLVGFAMMFMAFAATASCGGAMPSGGCCKVCSNSQPCGNGCIANGKTCHVGGGCACSG